MKKVSSIQPHILMGTDLFLFCKFVWHLHFSIKRKAFFRLCISFFILLLFTPFRWIELILDLVRKKEQVKAPIFIVGHFRSGTTYFHDAMNQLDNVVAPRMLDCLYPKMNRYFSFLLIPILKKALPEERLMDKMKVAWDSPQEEEFALSLMTYDTAISFLYAPILHSKKINASVLLNEENIKKKWLKNHLKFAQKLQTIHKGKTLVFKSPSNTARIQELLEIYPDAKFIHIVRNPTDVIPSTINLYRKLLPEFSLQNEQDVELTTYVFNFYQQVMHKYMETKGNLASDQLFELKYEEFVQHPIKTMQEAFSQLELANSMEGLEDFFNSRKQFTKNQFQVDEDLISRIKTECHAVITAYDYKV